MLTASEVVISVRWVRKDFLVNFKMVFLYTQLVVIQKQNLETGFFKNTFFFVRENKKQLSIKITLGFAISNH